MDGYRLFVLSEDTLRAALEVASEGAHPDLIIVDLAGTAAANGMVSELGGDPDDDLG